MSTDDLLSHGPVGNGVNSAAMDEDITHVGDAPADDTVIVPDIAPTGIAELAWSDGHGPVEDYLPTDSTPTVPARSISFLNWSAAVAILAIAAAVVAWFGLDFYRESRPVTAPAPSSPPPTTVTVTVTTDPPPTQREEPPEAPRGGMAYIQGLRLLGIPINGSDAAIIRSGHGICDALAGGTDAGSIGSSLIAENPRMSDNGLAGARQTANSIITTAINTLCPEQAGRKP